MSDETTATAPVTADPSPGTPVTHEVDPTVPTGTADPKVDGKSERMAAARAIVERRRAEQGEGSAEPAPEPTAAAPVEAPDEGAPPETPDPEPAAEPAGARYRDPETKKFISRDEAQRRGIAAEPAAAPSSEPDPGTPEAADPAGSTLTIRGPGRDGTEYEIALPAGLAEHDIETLQTWAKNGQRRAEHIRQMEAVERDRAELEDFKGMLKEDPAGVVLSYMPAERKVELARALLADEGVYEAVSEDVERWDRDPDARERSRLEAENARLREERKRADQTARQRQLQTHFTKIKTAVADMIPDTAPDATADQFYRDAMRDIADFHDTQGKVLSVEELPGVLERRLSLYGWTTRTSGEPPRNPSSGPNGRGAATGSADPSKLRRLTTAPAGVGAVTSGGGEPVPKDIQLGKEGTRAYLKKRFGLSR